MPSFSCFRVLLVLIASAATTAFAGVPFSEILSPAERATVGFDELSAGQASALNALVQRDLDAARQGGVTAFAKTFTTRRTAEERKRAGIEQLSESQRAELDRLVATVMASRPPEPLLSGSFLDGSSVRVSVTKPKPEVHGQVSLFVGGDSTGGSFYGGSFDAVVIDPSRRVMIGVGISEIRGKGFRGCGYGPYAPIW